MLTLRVQNVVFPENKAEFKVVGVVASSVTIVFPVEGEDKSKREGLGRGENSKHRRSMSWLHWLFVRSNLANLYHKCSES